MGAAHTPGPWEVQEPMDHELWIVEAGREAHEWRVIAGCPWPDERTDVPRKQVEANARLIAAAPDMLTALRSAKHSLEGLPAEADRAALDAVNAAIAKAEGR